MGTINALRLPCRKPTTGSFDPLPVFLSHANDGVTGFRTKQVLCVPLFGSSGKVVGVAQAINKLTDTPFNDDDHKLFDFFAKEMVRCDGWRCGETLRFGWVCLCCVWFQLVLLQFVRRLNVRQHPSFPCLNAYHYHPCLLLDRRL